eukprot:symbB.v1.2.000310.t1/scaffold6.1/size569917/13
MGLEASSASKAVLLTISRAVNWFVVYKQFCNANKNFQGQNFLQLNVIWMPLAGMLLSHLLCFLFMRTEKTRRSRCPAMIVALSQIGPLLELSPLPLCPRCSKKTTRAPIAVELAERAEVGDGYEKHPRIDNQKLRQKDLSACLLDHLDLPMS